MGSRVFTVLMLGLDRRPGDTGLAYRTDTMIIVSLDPTTNQIGILSIPRDLYVPVPGYAALQRVNTPMALGGPTLAMQTVQYNLGIRVHDYVVVDFDAVIGIVDAIGGIEVTTDYVINDPRYPDMKLRLRPVLFTCGHTPPGWQGCTTICTHSSWYE